MALGPLRCSLPFKIQPSAFICVLCVLMVSVPLQMCCLLCRVYVLCYVVLCVVLN